MAELLEKENKPQNKEEQECHECQECKKNNTKTVQKEKETTDPKYKLPPEVGRTRTVDIIKCKKCKATYQVCDCCLANGYGSGNKTKHLVVYKSQEGKWFYKYHDEFKKLNKGYCAENGCDGQVASLGTE